MQPPYHISVYEIYVQTRVVLIIIHKVHKVAIEALSSLVDTIHASVSFMFWHHISKMTTVYD